MCKVAEAVEVGEGVTDLAPASPQQAAGGETRRGKQLAQSGGGGNGEGAGVAGDRTQTCKHDRVQMGPLGEGRLSVAWKVRAKGGRVNVSDRAEEAEPRGSARLFEQRYFRVDAGGFHSMRFLALFVGRSNRLRVGTMHDVQVSPYPTPKRTSLSLLHAVCLGRLASCLFHGLRRRFS